MIKIANKPLLPVIGSNIISRKIYVKYHQEKKKSFRDISSPTNHQQNVLFYSINTTYISWMGKYRNLTYSTLTNEIR